MLDIGWPELFLIAVVTIIVVGPKELPRVVRTVSGMIRKMRGLAGEFQSTLDDMAREADLEDIKNEIEQVSEVDVADEFKAAVDPSGTMDGAFDLDEPSPAGSGDVENSILADDDRERPPPDEAVADIVSGAVEGGVDPVPEVVDEGDEKHTAARTDAEPAVLDDAEPPVEDAAEHRSGT
ncbi:MAG: twin-arginine translocase subunit TatB [Alphaproteobacteria bacterium]|nr:twin-arginine translocase subunit TatB [Alphaproteobacteria bacterium]